MEFNLVFDESEILFFLKWRCSLKEIRLQGSGIICIENKMQKMTELGHTTPQLLYRGAVQSV